MFIFDQAEGGRCADCADAATQRWNTPRRLPFLVCCCCLLSSSSREGVTQASGTAGKQSKRGIIFNLTEKWIGRIYSGQFSAVKSSKAGLNLYWRKSFKRRPVIVGNWKSEYNLFYLYFLSGRVEKAAGRKSQKAKL
jgi:hypothetical protein